MDIDSIVDFYNHRNDSSEYSDRLTQEFQERMDLVVAQPYLGQRAEQRGFRFVVVYPFQLFYYVTKTEVVVAKVWDARRDPKTLKLVR